jgi:ribonucleoside-triphosphate reductase
MHLRRYQGQGIDDDLNAAFEAVLRKEVLPSMRSMQFGGKAVEVNHSRMFNCAFTLCDRPAVFRESLFLLLSGCGVGYSVQKEHVSELPLVKPRHNLTDLPLRHHEIADTIEGWGAAADELVSSYFEGYYAEFSYAKILGKERRTIPPCDRGLLTYGAAYKQCSSNILDWVRQVLGFGTVPVGVGTKAPRKSTSR